MNARFMDEGVYEANVQRALDLGVIDDEPIAALLFQVGVDRRQLEIVEEVVHVSLLRRRRGRRRRSWCWRPAGRRTRARAN